MHRYSPGSTHITHAAPANPADGPNSAARSLIERAGQWFLESGIQEASGGVARYYRCDTGRNNPVSTEITGYAVSFHVYLHRLTGDTRYLEAARRAGLFLTRTAWDRALQTFPFEYAADGAGQAYAYFFDCGIIGRGLLSLWSATGEQEFLETARACGDTMARDFADAERLHPIIALPGKQPVHSDGRWSRNPGCYQLKSAMIWHELYVATGERKYDLLYESAAGQALRTRESFLPGEEALDRVTDRLHAYCYFLEGLLPAAHQPECGRALAEGLERVGALLREIRPHFERSDVYAQLLRLRLYADAQGVAELDEDAAVEEAAALPGFQAAGGDARIAGGFYFGRNSGQMLPHINPVSTAFCVQALEMWRRRQAGEFAPDWQALI